MSSLYQSWLSSGFLVSQFSDSIYKLFLQRHTLLMMIVKVLCPLSKFSAISGQTHIIGIHSTMYDSLNDCIYGDGNDGKESTTIRNIL